MRSSLAVLLLCSLLPAAGIADPTPSAASTPEPQSEHASDASAKAPPAASAPVAADAKQEPEDPMICKNRAITGTRFAKKACMPKSEWDAMTAKAEQDFATVRNRPVHCPDCKD